MTETKCIKNCTKARMTRKAEESKEEISKSVMLLDLFTKTFCRKGR